MHLPIRLLLLPLVLQISACAMNPPQLGGRFGDVSIAQASTDKKFVGEDVRWGGIVTGARWNDSGNCLEIAWSPIDPFTLQPVYLSTTRDTPRHPFNDDARPIRTAYLESDGQVTEAPRFLACGEQSEGSATYFVGAPVTIVGIVDTPQVFQVSRADCLPASGHEFSGTVHAADADQCVVSLPTIRTRAIVAWKAPPHTRTAFQVWGW